MSDKRSECMCSYLRNILWFCTYFGGFPLAPCAHPKNHTLNGCQFRISKWNISISIIIQIIIVIYVIWTTWSFLIFPEMTQSFMKYARTIVCVLNECDMYVSLIFSLMNARKTCNILESLSLVPSAPNDMKKLGKYLNRIMVFVLFVVVVPTVSWVIPTQTVLPFVATRIFDCTLGYMLIVILMLVPYAHLFVTIILCSLISSKFQHLASRIERHFKEISEPEVTMSNSHNIFMVKPNVPTNEEHGYNITNTTSKLNEFNQQYRTINNCLKETNSCIGFSVLVSIVASLYALIYFIFRKLTNAREHYNIHVVWHRNLRIVLFAPKIFLFIYTGHTIAKQSVTPLLALQDAEILHLPQHTQVQIQTLLLQWMRGPAYLDAFSIMHVGPWLVSPAIAAILRCSRWIGILPIVPNTRKPNHFTSGCSLHISKFWLITSIITQVTLGIYIVTTTGLRLYYGPEEDGELGFDWYVMTLGYMTMETDGLVSLFGGTFYSRRIAKTLVRLSRLDGKVSEMRELAYQLRKMLIFLLVIFCIKLSSFVGVAWVRLGKYSIFSGRRILDSSLGVFLRGVIEIYPHMQCALVIMMCLVISSKFKHQAETIKLTLDHVAFGATEEQTRNVKVRTATVKWMGEETDNTNTLHLERIGNQYMETKLCLEELNHCVGIQLLVALTANLFVTVYYLYRVICSSNNYNVIINIQQRMHCMISLISHIIKLILYMRMGQKLKTESHKPVKALQHGKLLRLPTLLREQIQCLILQWVSSEPSGLSAFNVILIGPWLLAPIAGNVITYLLVAIQFQMNNSYFSSMPENLTAILESVF